MLENFEFACDEHVLDLLEMGEFKGYADTILNMANTALKSYAIPVTSGMANHKSNIKRRIGMIGMVKKRYLKWVVLAVAVFAVLGIIGLTNPKSLADKSSAQAGSGTVADIQAESGTNADIDLVDNQNPQTSDNGTEEQAAPSPVQVDRNMYNDGMFPIYTADINTYEREISAYVSMPEDSSVKEKLDIIANKLSSDYFGNLPIVVTKIENKSGKKIAVISLNESKENQGITEPLKMKGDTWAIVYFQGSCQGTVTSTTLIESFLQKDYKGEWVDGVSFLYNNSSMNNVDGEHAPDLYEVDFR